MVSSLGGYPIGMKMAWKAALLTSSLSLAFEVALLASGVILSYEATLLAALHFFLCLQLSVQLLMFAHLISVR